MQISWHQQGNGSFDDYRHGSPELWQGTAIGPGQPGLRNQTQKASAAPLTCIPRRFKLSYWSAIARFLVAFRGFTTKNHIGEVRAFPSIM
jgi:hypothetical protein